MLRIYQGITMRNVETVQIKTMKNHIHATQVIGRQVNLLSYKKWHLNLVTTFSQDAGKL